MGSICWRRTLAAVALLVGLAAPRGSQTAIPSGPDEGPPGGLLVGQLLVARPHMLDPNFHRTVIFIVRHGPEGAFGIIVNRTLGTVKFASMVEALGSDPEGVKGEVPLHYGGPVEPKRGFILHSREEGTEPSIPVGSRYGVTMSAELLRAWARGEGPARALLATGHAGWGPGQLEGELARGDWAVAPPDDTILFDDAYDTKWRRAFNRRYVQT